MKKYVYYDETGNIKSVSDVKIDVKDCKELITKIDFVPSEYEVKNGKMKKRKVGLSTVKKQKIREISEEEQFLHSTDWKVTRHRDQLELGVETTLSEDEYVELQNKRQEAREILAGGK